MNKLLFLDFDGVLNSQQFYESRVNRASELDYNAVANLNAIIKATNCDVVISSTWRKFYSLEELRDVLVDYGLFPDFANKIIGVTPNLESKKEDSKLWMSVPRGEEIKAYLESINFQGNYVCLDDDVDFLPGQPLVFCAYEDGLTAKEASLCMEILNRRSND